MKAKNKNRATLGWREIISLPDFGVKSIRVKVDSGARTSALHAEDIKITGRRGHHKVHFTIIPDPKHPEKSRRLEADLIEKRDIKSSIGISTRRPVILTHIKVGHQKWPVEVTLVNRDLMGFPMLLGRTAIRGRFLIDPARSFLQTEPKLKASSRSPKR